jgi:transcriptional regulator with XRE-family HTH domain
MTLKTLLGKRIKDLRCKAGKTQAQIAELVGIDPKHQSCIENGRNFPSADLLEAYASAFDIDVCDIFKLRQNKDRNSLEHEIINLIKTAKDDDLKLIHTIVFSIIK